MNLSSLQTVLAVERMGTIVGAADMMNMDASNVSRIVAAVEHEIGLRLFDRTTRRLRITEAGERYLTRIGPLLDELEAAREEAHQTAVEPQGHLRLTSSVAFAIEKIVPLLPAFQDAYPQITVELLPSDANLSLLDQGLDLAVRLAAAPKGDLISTRVLSTRYRVVASPAYVERTGTLRTPEDLSDRNCLRFALPDFRSRWLFRVGADEPVREVEVGGSILISNALALRDAARKGMGAALLADWLIDRDLEDGKLVDLLPTWDCTATEFDTGAFILYPSRTYLPQKNRVMIDFLKDRLK
ncbi:LysR family transcriptional regulator [uncultured Litoreibacter sp.]|uniref:LysR family transcriptional regulator n=1 Tax=uncultured Litoreibacter sp. TaxID=1392394 RepID=UPI0026099146|nr:LysR family transcriptional regulator [uncultured Litoreibacter sp.]